MVADVGHVGTNDRNAEVLEGHGKVRHRQQEGGEVGVVIAKASRSGLGETVRDGQPASSGQPKQVHAAHPSDPLRQNTADTCPPQPPPRLF
jgi:hypothetical protein